MLLKGSSEILSSNMRYGEKVEGAVAIGRLINEACWLLSSKVPYAFLCEHRTKFNLMGGYGRMQQTLKVGQIIDGKPLLPSLHNMCSGIVLSLGCSHTVLSLPRESI